MKNKNVCPNCGELYASDLDKCPLCGTPAQVLERDDAAARKKAAETRKQRKAQEKEARRLRREAEEDYDEAEDELLEEERERRRAEKRRRRAEAADPQQDPEEPAAARERNPETTPAAPRERNPETTPAAPRERNLETTPAAARSGRRPAIQEEYVRRDRTQVPRFLLTLSFLVLFATLLIGGSYLLWRKDVVRIPIYDKLYQKGHSVSEKKDAAPGTDAPAPAATGSETADTETDDPWSGLRSCKSLSLEQTEIKLSYRNSLSQLTVLVEPKDTTDVRVFTSSDESVAKVTNVGVVTAVNPGTAVITVTCGKHTAECTVICDFTEAESTTEPSLDVTELELNNSDMTFFNPNEHYDLAVTNVPIGTKVGWKSLDESVAVVDDTGRVVAVGNGTTRVIATIGDLSAECWVRCNFQTNQTDESN